MRIIIASLCLILGFGLIRYGAVVFPLLQTPPDRFNMFISEDLHSLSLDKRLPKEWQSLRNVVVQINDPALSQWVEKINLPLKRNPAGTTRAEVSIMRWSDSPKYGVLVQIELFDIRTKNKVFELNRNYHIGYEW